MVPQIGCTKLSVLSKIFNKDTTNWHFLTLHPSQGADTIVVAGALIVTHHTRLVDPGWKGWANRTVALQTRTMHIVSVPWRGPVHVVGYK